MPTPCDDGPNCSDLELCRVRGFFREMDPSGEGTAEVMRETFDALYDGQRTGRYKIEHLMKTEKTHFGSVFEIFFQRRFELPGGRILDFEIDGIEVDCKYSHTGQWMLPPESFDRIVLVARANDRDSEWSMGLIRVTEENRRQKPNRDAKTQLRSEAIKRISWLHLGAVMPPNALLQMREEDVNHIMALKSGQARINELFRRAEGRRITRNVVATVAQQKDPLKRVRENGGARSTLRNEGYVVLSGDYKFHAWVAHELSGVRLAKGEFIAIQVCPGRRGDVEISGRQWRRVSSGGRPAEVAPLVPYDLGHSES